MSYIRRFRCFLGLLAGLGVWAAHPSPAVALLLGVTAGAASAILDISGEEDLG